VADGPTLGPDSPCAHDLINSSDYTYLVRGYPSNNVGVVGYLLGIGEREMDLIISYK
jgi:hypothetical protein